MPWESGLHAARELKVPAGELTKGEYIVKAGQIIEAEYGIDGTYYMTNGGITTTWSIINLAEGRTLRTFTNSTAEFCTDARVVEGILTELNVNATAEEKMRLERPIVNSPKTLELVSEAITASQRPERFPFATAYIQKALELDPHCELALEVQAQFDTASGKEDEAVASAQAAVKYFHDSSSAHRSLGLAYCVQQMFHVGRDEFIEAVRLNPYDAESYCRLGEVYRVQSKWDDAISNLNHATELSPYDAGIHAELGAAYAFAGQRDPALAEFAKAETFRIKGDIGVVDSLAIGYGQASDTPNAIRCCEEYLKLASASGIKSPKVEHYQETLDFLKASLVPRYIAVAEPKSFSDQEIAHFLNSKLSPDECRLTWKPLRCNTNMAKWASELVTGATNDEEKARLLFQGLEHRSHLMVYGHSDRSAEQVFNDWTNSEKGLLCQDYALLYVALARAVGLKAYCVAVYQDCDGANTYHACAGVVLGQKAVLIDPIYEWFGVPHKQYQFQNDVQALAIVLSQSEDLERRMIAVKLYPEWPPGYFSAALKLAYNGDISEARRMLEGGLKLDSKSWLALYAQAGIEIEEKNWKAVVEHAQLCLVFHPKTFVMAPHYLLAMGLYNQGDLEGARKALRDYLEEDSAHEYATNAYAAIASIDKSLRSETLNK